MPPQEPQNPTQPYQPVPPTPEVTPPAPIPAPQPPQPQTPFPQQPTQPQPQITQPLPQAQPQQPLPQAQPASQPYQYNYNQAPEAPSKRRKLLLILIPAIIAVVLAIIGGIVFYSLQQGKKPEAVFDKSIENALSLRQVEQEMVATDPKASELVGKQVIQYDLTDPKDSKVYYDIKLDAVEIQSYGTVKNEYIRFPKIDDLTVAFLDQSGVKVEKDKWVQIRKDGAVVDENTRGLLEPIDSRALFLGQYIFGNFSDADRKQLYDFAINNHIYKYDVAKVTTETIDGDPVYVYDVSVDADKLKEYNKTVAGIIGIPKADIDSVVDTASTEKVTNAKLYISKKHKRVVKVTAEQSGTEVQTTYRNFNNVKLPSEPSVK